MAFPTIKEHYPLYWTKNVQPLFFIQYILGFWLSVFCLPWKKFPERRRVEEKHFQSVIQRDRVNASILFLTTGVNCRSYSPTHSTFLLEGEAETLRLKWDEECSKRCCSCPFLTPSPPLIFQSPLRTCAKMPTCTFTDIQGHTNITCNKAKTFNKHW